MAGSGQGYSADAAQGIFLTLALSSPVPHLFFLFSFLKCFLVPESLKYHPHLRHPIEKSPGLSANFQDAPLSMDEEPKDSMTSCSFLGYLACGFLLSCL